MSKTNSILLVIVAILLALSIFTWHSGQGRADRFERGQRFLPNLNPDEIARVSVSGEEGTVSLERTGEQFTISEKSGYPAANDAVNRLVREVLDLSLEKEIGAGVELEEELGIEPLTATGVEVALANASGQEMVRFRIGQSFADGSYIQRRDEDDAPIYLASGHVDISSDTADFLDKVLVEVERSRVQVIEGPDFVVEKSVSGDLALAGLGAGEKGASGEIDGLRGLLSPLRYDQVWVADDDEVEGLTFEESLRIDLQDGSGYYLAAASAGERHFVRVRGYHTVERVEIALDTPDEELEEKAETLSRADEIQDFNDFHGSWVYEIGQWTGEKLALRRDDLIED